MEYLVFGILILLIALAAWDMLTDIADRQKGSSYTQPIENDFAEEI